MAITYNNLYMDIRQELHRAGIQAAISATIPEIMIEKRRAIPSIA